MLPSMRKVRIFCSDPDATDSSNDEDDQNPKKEKKLIGEMLVPLKMEPSGSCHGLPSDDEDDQNSKEEKLMGGVLVPMTKEPSSRFRGVRRRSWGRWQAEIRNPFTKKRETSTHKTEEEAAAAYQEKREKYDAMKAQLSVLECTTLCSSSSVSCMSTSMKCKQEQEAHNGVGVSTETDLEPTDGSILNSSPTTKEISVNALLDQLDKLPVSDWATPADKQSPIDESILNSPIPKEISVNALLDQLDKLPVSDSAIPADKHSPTDEGMLNSPTHKEISVNALIDQRDELPVSGLAIPVDRQSPRDAFPISDFIGANCHPVDNDYIGLADISQLPFPFDDLELFVDAEPDWSSFDIASIERELNDEFCSIRDVLD